MDLSTPKIMGILNATPDSFFDGGKYQQLDEAIIRIEKMIEDGVDILDIGAFSTRPGADIIDEKEERNRLVFYPSWNSRAFSKPHQFLLTPSALK